MAVHWFLLQELLQPVFYSPEDYGDLFMDITDALTECGEDLLLYKL